MRFSFFASADPIQKKKKRKAELKLFRSVHLQNTIFQFTSLTIRHKLSLEDVRIHLPQTGG